MFKKIASFLLVCALAFSITLPIIGDSLLNSIFEPFYITTPGDGKKSNV